MDWRTARASYDRFASRYDAIFEALQAPKIRALRELMGPETPAEPVVDLGAGTGLFARLTGLRCIELDASAEMLRRPSRPWCIQSRLDRLPLPDASVGTLVAVTSLIDYAPGDPEPREWARVLRPGGLLLLSVMLRENLAAIDADLAAAGFETGAQVVVGQDRAGLWALPTDPR
jgi:malonyl-CoA O-methyltransferase